MITQQFLKLPLAFFQYALKLFCAALGVGLSAFIGKLHSW